MTTSPMDTKVEEENVSPAPAEEEEDEAILEGMDLEGIGDDRRSNDDDEEEDDNASGANNNNEDDDVDHRDDLAKEDALEMEEARKERLELMAAEGGVSTVGASSGDVGSQLDYLLKQSEVFAHFLAGSVAINNKKGKKKGGSSSSRGKKGRMTEAEEDERMLKAAQSKRQVVRLDKQPSNLAPTCKMHDYQVEGLNWIIKLHCNGINGILADEMGLGKTLQTISFFAYLREHRGITGPHIVVVPKSVVGNWIREFKKFCPCIKAIRMGGTKAERQKFLTEDLPKDPATGKFKWDVLVTSYEGCLREKGKLSKIPFHYLVIDEAHRIKNENSSLSKAVRMMKTDFRFLITGTPLQNNLRELWALLNFLMPEIFGDAEQFDEWFSLSDEAGKENVVKKLHTVLRPFMLRRVKKDVATSLPPKKETKLYIGMTDMQQDWYVKVLQKDAHELNKLGGPDKVRLLNVLMQLRKVCNHPYLFDGAEPGPPYTDGPHLWENSGKMMLLNKLLKKLKSKDSRVLIFSQMTRVLDILEDYCRYVGYEYCRIDGNTDGEKRDSQMDEFNKEGSSKFVFLLSTRAGGLGINLATADIVILYDSDFNPQCDLQAMDRAHRIGQKKPVQVFRFITEGTIEEKIIERADRKLFLDAAVIQQGRLAEQHSSLEKDELMKMVRFGADQILSKKGGTYSDEDIDALIAKGEERTEAIQAELQTNAKHDLANFTLLADDEAQMDTFQFGGKNYRENDKAVGNFINLPQRQRKRNYDVNEYFRDAMSSGNQKPSSESVPKKRKKGPALHDYQLFDIEGLNRIADRERTLVLQKANHLQKLERIRDKIAQAANGIEAMAEGQRTEDLIKKAEAMEKDMAKFELSEEERKEKEALQAEGFPDWSRKDFKQFCVSLEKFGRYNFKSIAREVVAETGKDEREIQRYYVAFWTNYRRLNDWQKVLERIERGERKLQRLREIGSAIQEKVERHLYDSFAETFKDTPASEVPPISDLIEHSWHRVKINYGSAGKGRAYQEDEDAFLVCMMYKHGYGAAERIRMEIRRAWQFRFDWYFKPRSAQEIQKRCDTLVKMIEKENEEIRKAEEAERTVFSTPVKAPSAETNTVEIQAASAT